MLENLFIDPYFSHPLSWTGTFFSSLRQRWIPWLYFFYHFFLLHTVKIGYSGRFNFYQKTWSEVTTWNKYDWEHNIKIYLKGGQCEDGNWIQLAQDRIDRVQWRFLVKKMMHLTTWVTISFQKRKYFYLVKLEMEVGLWLFKDKKWWNGL